MNTNSEKIEWLMDTSNKINSIIACLMSWEVLWGFMITGVLGSVVTKSSAWIIGAVILMGLSVFLSIILMGVSSFMILKVEKLFKEIGEDNEN